jgi:hypothetical protein
MWAQLHTADGSKLGPETQTNLQTEGAQWLPYLDTGSGSRFAVMWTDVSQEGASTSGLRAIKSRIF